MDFLVPKLSATMETAKVVRWLKQAGDSVRMGEALVEIETDKATIEVEAPADGSVTKILAPEGAELPIGGVLAQLDIGGAASAAPAPKPRAQAAPVAAPVAAAPKAAPAPAPAPAPVRSAAASGNAIPPRVMASPLARRLASERGVDIATLVGTGPNRRVRKRDVLAAASGGRSMPAVARRSAPTGEAVAGGTLSSMRLGVAETVMLSRRTIPSFTLDRWVESTALRAARDAIGPHIERNTGVKPTVTDFLLQAMADVLRAQPAMLDRWVETDGAPRRVPATTVDIGLVVALTDGMMIPVLRDLGDKSLGEIAQMRRDAVARVRAGRLTAADAAPVAIALSNLGTGGADRFDAIISPGQASILAIGREHDSVIARGGWPTVAPGFHATLSVDHRLIDGVRGAAFLGALAERIEFGPWTAD